MFLHEAVYELYDNVKVVSGDTLDELVAKDIDMEIVTIDKDAINTKITELQAEYVAKEYQRDRAIAYPALAEQFDKLWHDINNGTLDNTGAFYTALKTVKDDNPKPGE